MPKRKTTKNKAAAAETYAKRRSDIARLLDVLQMELDRHDAEFSDEPTNWGAVGDLDHLRDQLIWIVAFAGGAKMEREDVERFLAEAE